jgi:hypothetical protein
MVIKTVQRAGSARRRGRALTEYRPSSKFDALKRVQRFADCLRRLAFLSIACMVSACGADSVTSVVAVATPSSLCSASLSTRTVGIDAAAVDGQITVVINRECQWTANSDVDWIGLNPRSGQGDSAITYSAKANPAALQRRGTISVNDQRIDVTQAGVPCKFSLSPSSAAIDPTGGRVTVAVSTQAGCSWSGTSHVSWISIVESPATQTGPGTLILRVDANGPTPRSGSVTIADQDTTISQAALPPPSGPPGPCSLTLSAAAETIGAAGGIGTVTLSGLATCNWSAVSNASWIAIIAGSNGTGPGTVQFRIAANPAVSARSGSITIAGQEFIVSQDAAAPAPAPCAFVVSSPTQSVGANGGTGQITVTASAPTCAWTASSVTSWLTVSSGANGTGDGTMTYVAAANATTSQRSGTLIVAGETIVVTQAATAPCTFSLSASSQSVAASGGSGTVTVSASADSCAWTVTGAPTWVTVTTGANGTGNGTAQFTVAANTDSSSRTATLTIAGQTFTVSQAAATIPCTFSLSALSQSVAAAGGTGTVMVTASAGSCGWTATGAPTWITITAGAGGTGTGTVQFTVAANTSLSPRTAPLTIAGQTFTVSQAAATCTFSLSASSQSIAAGGGTGAVTVTASAGSCGWTATGAPTWITITAGAGGTGTGTVQFTVAANTSLSPRTAPLTIAGQMFTVSQAAGTCTFSLSASSQSIAAGGGTGMVTVTTSSGSCAWTTTGAPTWVTVTSGTSGTGTGTVLFTVAANTNPSPRTAVLTIGGQTFTISQAAAPCTFTVFPTSASFAAGSGSGQIGVTASAPACTWTAATSTSWLTITSGGSGTGNGTTKYDVVANTTTSPRTGTLTVAGQPVSITQTGQPLSLSGKVSGKTGTCPNLTFTLSGNTIKTNSTTAFSVSCTAVKDNDKVAVTGLVQADGSVLASTLGPG